MIFDHKGIVRVTIKYYLHLYNETSVKEGRRERNLKQSGRGINRKGVIDKVTWWFT